MGTDKASLGNPPWAHRVAQALQEAGCSTVELQGGVSSLRSGNWRQFADAAIGAGPVPAVLQAAERHPGSGIVFAVCDLPNLTGRDVETLVHAAGVGTAAYRIQQRANWSLVALGPRAAARLATAGPGAGIGRSLNALFGPAAQLLDPLDPVSVTDIDEPPGNLHTAVDTRDPLKEEPVSVEEISVDELAARLAPGVILLDVREAQELVEVRVPGVTHIPLGELETRATEIPEGELFVICRSGARSMVACQQLGAMGRPAVNVAGGTIAWIGSGRDTESG